MAIPIFDVANILTVILTEFYYFGTAWLLHDTLILAHICH